MAKFAEWKESLICLLSDRMRNHSFSRRNKDQAFERKFDGIKYVFHLAFIDHDEDFDVTADVAIRFDAVEDLVNSHNSQLRPSEKRRTATIGCELGNLSENKQRRWSITSLKAVSEAAESIYAAFESIGIPYFEKYSDPAVALDVLSGDTPDSWRHCPLHGTRAERAVCMALVLKGKDEARKLAHTKQLYLEHRKDFGLESYKTLLSILNISSING